MIAAITYPPIWETVNVACYVLAVADFDGERYEKHIHELIVDILNWKTVNKATEQSVNEVLALVKPFVMHVTLSRFI